MALPRQVHPPRRPVSRLVLPAILLAAAVSAAAGGAVMSIEGDEPCRRRARRFPVAAPAVRARVSRTTRLAADRVPASSQVRRRAAARRAAGRPRAHEPAARLLTPRATVGYDARRLARTWTTSTSSSRRRRAASPTGRPSRCNGATGSTPSPTGGWRRWPRGWRRGWRVAASPPATAAPSSPRTTRTGAGPTSVHCGSARSRCRSTPRTRRPRWPGWPRLPPARRVHQPPPPRDRPGGTHAVAGAPFDIVLLHGEQGDTPHAEAIFDDAGLAEPPPCPATAGDPAVILYTSGTTSDPKGVVLTHGNLLAERAGAFAVVHVTEDDCILGVLPLFHALAQMANLLLPVLGRGARRLPRDAQHDGTPARRWPSAAMTLFACVPQFFYLIHQRVTQEVARSSWARVPCSAACWPSTACCGVPA